MAWLQKFGPGVALAFWCLLPVGGIVAVQHARWTTPATLLDHVGLLSPRATPEEKGDAASPIVLAWTPPADPRLNTRHVTSFVVFPGDCNANPPMLFGGKMLGELDRCAAVTARRLLYHSPTAREAVTASIQNVNFRRPGRVKDLIFLQGRVTALGDKSITIGVTAERENPGGEREVLAEGTFLFVAYDPVAAKSVPHGLKLPE